MTERERLIELINAAHIKCANIDCADDECCEYEMATTPEMNCRDLLYVDYLLANGVIVPPCKVGDTVYIVDETSNEETGIDKAKVTEICYNGVFVYFDIDKDTYKYSAGQIGKTVFPTKEEALKALELKCPNKK